MRVAVITEAAPGSTRAHAINVFKTAGGLERLGHDVTVYCAPPHGGESPPLALDMYGEPRVRVVCAPRSIDDDARSDDDRSRALGMWAAHQAARDGAEFVYARHFWGALAAADLGLPTIMETHAHVGDLRAVVDACFRATTRRGNALLGVATISPVLRDHYVQRGARATRVAVVPDGVDLEMFAPPEVAGPSPYAQRHGPHAVYCGHLYDYKGIPTILNAASLSPEVTWHLVGGDASDVARVRAEVERRRLPHVLVHGGKPYRDIPSWMWHADVLLLPPEANHPSARWTSPVKLGEYLASGPPIVASDIPGLRTWVSEPAVTWFRASDPSSLVSSVRAVFRMSAAEHQARRQAAARLAERFSYTQRARQLLALGNVRSLQRAA
jgi:glycosyltransferase involved in cell wall biosynthesis